MASFFFRAFRAHGLTIIFLAASTTAHAGALDQFSQAAICTDGKIDTYKLVAAALKDVKEETYNKPPVQDTLWSEKLQGAISNQKLYNFLEQHDRSLFEISGPKAKPTDTYVDAWLFLTEPDRFTRNCIKFSKNPDVITASRKELTTAGAEFAKVIRIRGDVDGLSKGLKQAKAASVTYADNKVSDNAVTAYGIVVGRQFNIVGDPGGVDEKGRSTEILIDFTPYIRFEGANNSSPNVSDLENWGAGVKADIYGIPVLNFLETSISLSAEYITDSEQDTSLASGELVAMPYVVPNLPLINAVNSRARPLGPEGPYVEVDLAARLKFGHVFDPGDKPLLLQTSQFFRAGYSTKAKIGFDGTDILGGLWLSAGYIYFDTLEGQGGGFGRFDAELGYDFTDHLGIKLSRTKGKDPTKLDQLDLYQAGLSFKF